MHKENLRDSLKELHSELAATDGLDKDMRTLLRNVSEDIERLLEEHPEEHSGMEQIEEAVVRFEVSHPRLAKILSDLADTISKLGI